MAQIVISAWIIIIVSALYIVSFLINPISGRSNGVGTNSGLSSYECGFEAYEDARGKFDILYYIVALLYLIFDQEIIFLFPLSSIQISLNNIVSIVLGMIFVIILTIGFFYEYYNGALQVR